MKKSQFEQLVREVIRETIRKVDGKYVVYPEKGGKRLGTHSSKAAAEKQLTAIHLNKMNEQEMSQDDFNKVGDVLRDPTKAKQIHNLLLQMFPQQDGLLNYNYKNDSYAEFKRFIFHIDKHKLEGPTTIQHTDLKLDPQVMKDRERKYQDYVNGKINKYFRDTDSDPRKADLSKMPPITVDQTGEVMDGNHRAFLAIKQQKPLKGYRIINGNNTHPNVAKILQVVGRSVQENYADGKENEIVDDILSGLNEGSLNSVLEKMKQYAKKGLLTVAMVASVAQGLQAQGINKNQADQIQQTGIELVQQTSKLNKQVEKQNLNKVKKLLGNSFEKMNKLAQQTGTILVANKGLNLNVLKSMNQMNAKSHFSNSVEKISLQDQKVLKAKDGKYIVVSFYKIIINENYADGKVKDALKKYIDDYTEIDVNLLKDLLKDKKKYPDELDPRTGGNKFGYRGMTFKKEFIDKLKPVNTSNGVTEYEVPSNIKVNSRSTKGFLSFTVDEEVAKGFGHYSGYVDHKKSPDRVGGYVRVSLDNPNFILHPDFTGELSKDLEYSKESEKETLYIGNSFTPDRIYVVDESIYNENYADGKVKGKSRPGRVKKAGASCKGSVTDLRAKAKKYGGEKGKMYHWCANMKGGK